MNLIQRFNHYGFDTNIYAECMGLITRTNRNHSKIINVWFSLINIFYFTSANLNLFNVDVSRSSFYLSFIIVPLFILWMVVFLAPKNTFFSILCTAADIIMFEIYSILSSNAEPYTVSWIFLILLVVVAFSYIETMGRMGLILLGMSMLFVRLALILHFAFQRARVNEYVTTIHDIRNQRQLEITSSFDALTSLLNRGKFFSLADQTIQKHKGELMALVLLDLDGFKSINDNYGHQTGDRAIQLAAKSIQKTLNIDEGDKWEFPAKVLRDRLSFAGRLGGDEYIILLQGYEKKELIYNAVSNVLNDLHRIEDGNIHGLKASIGITMIGDEDKNTDLPYKRADDALYVSKENGKDQININQF